MARRFRCNAHAWKEGTAEDTVCVAMHTTPSTVWGGQEHEQHDFRCASVTSSVSPRVSGPPPLVASGRRWTGVPQIQSLGEKISFSLKFGCFFIGMQIPVIVFMKRSNQTQSTIIVTHFSQSSLLDFSLHCLRSFVFDGRLKTTNLNVKETI